MPRFMSIKVRAILLEATVYTTNSPPLLHPESMRGRILSEVPDTQSLHEELYNK